MFHMSTLSPFLLCKISKALYSKAIPLSLFMHYPTDSKCLWQRMSTTESSSSQTQPFLPFFFSSQKRKGTGGQKQRGQKRNVRDEREQRKLPRLQQHSFSVRHLLFYCNLMALLSPGASRQSPLYHMAIISVALLCDSLTLSTVTCDPL